MARFNLDRKAAEALLAKLTGPPSGLVEQSFETVKQDPEARLSEPDEVGVAQLVAGSERDHGPDLGADFLGHAVRRAVGPLRDRAQHGEALGGELEATIAEKLGRIAHQGSFLGQKMDLIKICGQSSRSAAQVRPGQIGPASAGPPS